MLEKERYCDVVAVETDLLLRGARRGVANADVVMHLHWHWPWRMVIFMGVNEPKRNAVVEGGLIASSMGSIGVSPGKEMSSRMSSSIRLRKWRVCWKRVFAWGWSRDWRFFALLPKMQ